MRAALATYHEQMTAAVERGEALLKAGPPGVNVAELSPIRLQMAQIITSYQLFVHREVFEPLIRSGNAGWAEKARALKTDCILLAEDFRAFVRVWATKDAVAHWDEYRPAAAAILGRIRAHIAAVRGSELPRLAQVRAGQEQRLAG